MTPRHWKPCRLCGVATDHWFGACATCRTIAVLETFARAYMEIGPEAARAFADIAEDSLRAPARNNREAHRGN